MSGLTSATDSSATLMNVCVVNAGLYLSSGNAIGNSIVACMFVWFLVLPIVWMILIQKVSNVMGRALMDCTSLFQNKPSEMTLTIRGMLDVRVDAGVGMG